MKRLRITSHTALLTILALTILFLGCASKNDGQPAPVKPAAENYSHVPVAPAIHGPSVAYADPMWKAYASRGQAFADCGGASAPKQSVAPPRSGGAGKSAPKKSSQSRSSKSRSGGQAKAPATPSKAAQSPATAAVCPDGCVPAPVCPDGCIPAPGQSGTSAQRGPAPDVPGQATAPGQAAAPVLSTSQMQPPAAPGPQTASPATPEASAAMPGTGTPVPAQAPTPAPAQSPAPEQAAAAAQPAQSAPAAAAATPGQGFPVPPAGERQEGSAPLEMPATAPPVPTGAALGSMSSGGAQ